METLENVHSHHTNMFGVPFVRIDPTTTTKNAGPLLLCHSVVIAVCNSIS